MPKVESRAAFTQTATPYAAASPKTEITKHEPAATVGHGTSTKLRCDLISLASHPHDRIAPDNVKCYTSPEATEFVHAIVEKLDRCPSPGHFMQGRYAGGAGLLHLAAAAGMRGNARTIAALRMLAFRGWRPPAMPVIDEIGPPSTSTPNELRRSALDPNQRDHDGKTALHLLAEHGSETQIASLLRPSSRYPWHVELDARDNEGAIPLHRAAQAGNYRVVKALLNYYGNASTRRSELQSPSPCGSYYTAHEQNWEDTLNSADFKGRTLLHYAVEAPTSNNVALFTSYIDIDLERPDHRNITPVEYAEFHNKPAAAERIRKKIEQRKKLVDRILAAG